MPAPQGYPATPTTLGEHIRKCRLDRGELQREAASHIGVSPFTLMNWELGHRQPRLEHRPSIDTYLGYCLVEPATRLGERLARWRRANGVSRKALATELGLDDSTLWRLETGITRQATVSVRAAIRELLGN